MLVRLTKTFIVTVIAALFGVLTVWCQETKQQPKKEWKDRGEYDLYVAITKETANNKKLELLNTWKQKYAETDFRQERLQLYLVTYQALNQPQNMVDTAHQMLANDPKDFQALYWITLLTPTLGKSTPDVLDGGEKAARGLLANVDSTFAADKRPATTPEAEWKKARTDSEALAHKTLGWVVMQRKNNEAAEAAFRKSLQLNPNAGEVSYWLGTVLLAQRVPEKQAEALYHFARAGAYEGAGALNPQGRQEVNKYLEKVYSTYHGSMEGLDEVRTVARTNALPPAGFKVKSAAEVAFEKEQRLREENPMLALWLSVKKELTGPNGEQYWDNSVKRAALPGGVSGVEKFKGKLISHTPARNPRELVLGISDANTPEVTLKLDEAMSGSAEPGTEIDFDGVATEFSKEPFMVTFEVEKGNVQGWPAPAPRRAPTKKATKKK